MGNCQAAEAATVVIQHPGGKVERMYWSVSAQEVMTSNPGHYVALVMTRPVAARTENGAPVKQLKLLRPNDMLCIGQVYRLVSYEEMLREYAAKKSVKLGRLLKERGVLNLETKKNKNGPSISSKSNPSSNGLVKKVHYHGNSGSSTTRRSHGGGGGGHWRPALHSISEIGN